MLKKFLKIAPTPTTDGAFIPSPLALKLATSSKTDYDGGAYPDPYKSGKLRVLMICTEESNMTMQNGKVFSTGNHPVEIALPMLHLISAGFEIDVITPTGAASRSKCGRCLIKTRMSQGCSIRLRRRLKPQKALPILQTSHDPRGFLYCPIHSRRAWRDAQASR